MFISKQLLIKKGVTICRQFFIVIMAGRNTLSLKEKIKIINVQEQEKLSVREIAKR